MVRISTTSSDGDVRALAFRDPSSGELAIVGHNSRPDDASLRINLQGLQVAGSVFHLVQPTASTALVQGAGAPVKDGVTSATVAGDGFFTLTTSGEISPAAAAQPQTSVVPTTSSAVRVPGCGLGGQRGAGHERNTMMQRSSSMRSCCRRRAIEWPCCAWSSAASRSWTIAWSSSVTRTGRHEKARLARQGAAQARSPAGRDSWPAQATLRAPARAVFAGPSALAYVDESLQSSRIAADGVFSPCLSTGC
jgi:hypothetical protein